MNEPLLELSWIGENLDTIWEATREHLFLTVVPVLIGLLVSLLLSAAVLRKRALFQPIAEISGLLYTIPALAMFALLWPVFGGVRGRTTVAIVTLTTYTILILVRNIVTGIDGVSDVTRDAARGLGYRPVRMLLEVELPLALPAIAAGVRIATVTIIGLVTVTALIGLGGYGALILDGFRSGPFPTSIVVGVVLSVLLAAAVDYLLLRITRLLTPWDGVGAGG